MFYISYYRGLAGIKNKLNHVNNGKLKQNAYYSAISFGLLLVGSIFGVFLSTIDQHPPGSMGLLDSS